MIKQRHKSYRSVSRKDTPFKDEQRSESSENINTSQSLPTEHLLKVSMRAKRAASQNAERATARCSTEAESIYLADSQSSAYNSRRFLDSDQSSNMTMPNIDTLYDDAIKKVGGYGFYQKLATLCIIASYASWYA